jgi:hypothetical protein
MLDQTPNRIKLGLTCKNLYHIYLSFQEKYKKRIQQGRSTMWNAVKQADPYIVKCQVKPERITPIVFADACFTENRKFIVLLDAYTFCAFKEESEARDNLFQRYKFAISAVTQNLHSFDEDFVEWFFEYILQLGKIILCNRDFMNFISPLIKLFVKDGIIKDHVDHFVKNEMVQFEKFKYYGRLSILSFKHGNPSKGTKYYYKNKGHVVVDATTLLAVSFKSLSDNKLAIDAAIEILKMDSPPVQEDIDKIFSCAMAYNPKNSKYLLYYLENDSFFEGLTIDFEKAWYYVLFNKGFYHKIREKHLIDLKRCLLIALSEDITHKRRRCILKNLLKVCPNIFHSLNAEEVKKYMNLGIFCSKCLTFRQNRNKDNCHRCQKKVY